MPYGLGQLQNTIDQKEATDLEQKKTNIQVAGQIKASVAKLRNGRSQPRNEWLCSEILMSSLLNRSSWKHGH